MLHERFAVEGILGRGRFATVYRARDGRLKRTVALKVFDRLSGLDGRERARFIQEARILARLEHLNVVRLYDASFVGRMPYLVLEYVDGEDLRRWTAASSAPPGWPAIQFVAHGVLDSLAYAHARQILHRDVKPENVLVTTDPTDRARIQSVKLGDFGLTRLLATSSLARPKDIVATGGYLAPECVRGEPHSVCSDLYAVGVLLYELAAGYPPFASEANGQRSSSPTPLRVLRPDLPPRFDEIVMQLLECAHGNRPARAESVAQALAAIVADDRGPSGHVTDAQTVGPRKNRRGPATDSRQAVRGDNLVQFPFSGALPSRAPSPSVRKSRNR